MPGKHCRPLPDLPFCSTLSEPSLFPTVFAHKGLKKIPNNRRRQHCQTDNLFKKPTTVKPVLSGHSKEDQKWFSMLSDYPLMHVKSIAECSKGSILQYFRPSLSYHLSLISLFCLFLSGRLRQVLLYGLVFYVYCRLGSHPTPKGHGFL